MRLNIFNYCSDTGKIQFTWRSVKYKYPAGMCNPFIRFYIWKGGLHTQVPIAGKNKEFVLFFHVGYKIYTGADGAAGFEGGIEPIYKHQNFFMLQAAFFY